jgi:hypothetical protein
VSKPRAEDYPTAWSDWTARRAWLRPRGGSLLPSLGIAIFFGCISGSVVALSALIAFALVMHGMARSS